MRKHPVGKKKKSPVVLPSGDSSLLKTSVGRGPPPPPLPTRLHPSRPAKKKAKSSPLDAVFLGDARWAVVTGDSTKVIASLADNFVACTITDPPYDEKTHDGARTLWGTGARWRSEKGREKAKEIKIDFPPLSSFAFVPQLLRVSRRWVLAFCSLEQLGDYRLAAGSMQWVRAGIWHRPDGTPQLSGDRPAQGAEGIAIMHRKGRKFWNGGGERAHWTYGVERAELNAKGKRHHPTQKPLALMLRLIDLFTDPGDLVFDPFCGSGTTGVAALRLGRRFIGVERNAGYAKIARQRLAAETRGLSVADVERGQFSIFDAMKATA